MKNITTTLVLLFVFSPFITSSMTQPTTLHAAGLNYAEDQYFQSIKDHIMQDWSQPPGEIKGFVTVTLKFKKDGSIISRKVETLSDNDEFNKYVSRKIGEAVPLPPIPDEFGWDQSEISLRFGPKR